MLAPADELRYSPGSLLMIVSVSEAERNRFAERLIDERMLLSLDKVRALLEGRVPEEEIGRARAAVLDAAVLKRLQASETVVIAPRAWRPASASATSAMAAEAGAPGTWSCSKPPRKTSQDGDLESAERVAAPPGCR